MSESISMDKEYRYRNGEPVRVLCVDRNSTMSVVSMRSDGALFVHQKDGRFYESRGASDYDLVEVKPYDDWKIDDPIWVWESNPKAALKRHFAGIHDGYPMAWDSGCTSFTSHNKSFTSKWTHASKTDPRTGTE